MAFPPPTQTTNVTDATEQSVLHPQLHNANGAAINDLTGEALRLGGAVSAVDGRVNVLSDRVTVVEADLSTLAQEVQQIDQTVDAHTVMLRPVGTIRGRSNIDAVIDGGSVRYTTVVHAGQGVTDTGDGSGYTVATGVYGVTASTVQDGGDDMTCYVSIGGRGAAVGARLAGDTASYVAWTGRVVAGEQISIRVRMPVPRAVVGGRLEIWRIAEST